MHFALTNIQPACSFLRYSQWYCSQPLKSLELLTQQIPNYTWDIGKYFS